MSGYIAQVNPRVEDLADIAEARAAKRHIAKPERAKAQLLGSFGQCDLVEHARSVPIEGLQRKEQSQAQMTRSEGSAEPSMLLIRNSAWTIHNHLTQWKNVNRGSTGLRGQLLAICACRSGLARNGRAKATRSLQPNTDHSATDWGFMQEA